MASLAGSERFHVRVRVGAVIAMAGPRILMVRHEKADRSYWLLPGGGLEFEETLEACLERELREETGLEVRAGRLLFSVETVYPDRRRHIIHLIFLAHVVSGTLVPPEDPRVKECGFLSIPEIQSVTVYPNLKVELAELAAHGFALPARHLGTRWD